MTDIQPRDKLKASLEVMRIARSGIDNCYEKIDEWKDFRKRLKKQKKNVSILEFKIEKLEHEIEKIELHASNMDFGGIVDSGFGGGGGGTGSDAAGH